jgi:hypothetical protein
MWPATHTWVAVIDMLERRWFGAEPSPSVPAEEQDRFDALIAKAVRRDL